MNAKFSVVILDCEEGGSGRGMVCESFGTPTFKEL